MTESSHLTPPPLRPRLLFLPQATQRNPSFSNHLSTTRDVNLSSYVKAFVGCWTVSRHTKNSLHLQWECFSNTTIQCCTIQQWYIKKSAIILMKKAEQNLHVQVLLQRLRGLVSGTPYDLFYFNWLCRVYDMDMDDKIKGAHLRGTRYTVSQDGLCPRCGNSNRLYVILDKYVSVQLGYVNPLSNWNMNAVAPDIFVSSCKN